METLGYFHMKQRIPLGEKRASARFQRGLPPDIVRGMIAATTRRPRAMRHVAKADLHEALIFEGVGIGAGAGRRHGCDGTGQAPAEARRHPR
jgi:hypothetical protein